MRQIIFCLFSQVKERTLKDPLLESASQVETPDMRAFFQGNLLTVISRGGKEFILNLNQEILAVYPLFDGLMIKCNSKADQCGANQNAFNYISLTGHPLNDRHPVGLKLGSQRPEAYLLNTLAQMIHVDAVLPIAILQQGQTTCFCLVHQAAFDENTTDFLERLKPQARNQELPSLMDSPQLVLQSFFQINSDVAPIKALIRRGLSQYELRVLLLYKESNLVQVVKGDIRTMEFTLQSAADAPHRHVIEGTDDVCEISYLRMHRNHNKSGSSTSDNLLISDDFVHLEQSRNVSPYFKFFKHLLQSNIGQQYCVLRAPQSLLEVYLVDILLAKIQLAPLLSNSSLPISACTFDGRSKWLSLWQVDSNDAAPVRSQIECCIQLNQEISEFSQILAHMLEPDDYAIYLQKLVKDLSQPGKQWTLFLLRVLTLFTGFQYQSRDPPARVLSAKSSHGSSSKLLDSQSQNALLKVLKQPSAFEQMMQQMSGNHVESVPAQPVPHGQPKKAILQKYTKQLVHILKLWNQDRILSRLDEQKPDGMCSSSTANWVLKIIGELTKANQGVNHPKNDTALDVVAWSEGLDFEIDVYFEKTRKVVRIFEVIYEKQASSLQLISNDLYRPLTPLWNQFQFYSLEVNAWVPQAPQNYHMRNQQKSHKFEKILQVLKEENFGYDQINQLPYQVQLPLLEILRYCRLHFQEIQTEDWPPAFYKLIQREDVMKNIQTGATAEGPQGVPSSLKPQMSAKFALQRAQTSIFDTQPGHGAAELDNYIQLDQILDDALLDSILPGLGEKQTNSRVTEQHQVDTRQQEIEFRLKSDLPIKLTLGSLEQAASDAEKPKILKAQLDRKFKRHMSKCVGRGALELGCTETLPTEKLNFPKISQTGFLPRIQQGEEEEATIFNQGPSKLLVELTSKEERESLDWANFHNGVASALKINQDSFQRNQLNLNQTFASENNVRNWIIFHRPQEPKNDHGGFLLGLGLLGQLDTLRPTDVYQHLKTAHNITCIGILLGRAASKVGSCDERDSRMMCLHIPALLPQNLSVEFSLAVQAAAVIGSGLLYLGTGQRLITEMLLTQIDKKAQSDKLIERQGYALAAGIGLGLVNLASPNKIKDFDLDERLITYIEGGKQKEIPRSLNQKIQNQHKSSAVKETDEVNTYVTAAGGLVALCLIYLKSNNRKISDRIVVPQTFEQLDYVRPQVLILKVLTRNLIMWDQIFCSQQWIDSQVPPVIKLVYETKDEDELNMKLGTKINQNEVDFASISVNYVFIQAAACLAIGFKYAGTCSQRAKKLLISRIEWFRNSLRIVPSTTACGGPIQPNNQFHIKNQVDKTTVDTALCMCLFAVGMVMAGSCDVEATRTCLVLRKRFEQEMHYGYTMAVHMALGFLYLGSGSYTFSRSNKALAGLLCAVYPVFPSSPSDNCHHLQALRHFYVFALESRLLQAREIDGGASVSIDVELAIETEQGIETSTVKTPVIVPGRIISIALSNNKDYHDVQLMVQQATNMSPDPTMAMEVDQYEQSKPCQYQEGGEFDQTNLYQILYVKRKNLISAQDKQLKPKIPFQILHSIEKGGFGAKLVGEAQPWALEMKDLSIKAFKNLFCVKHDASSHLLDLLSQTMPIDQALDRQDQLSAEWSPSIDTHSATHAEVLRDCFENDKMQALALMLHHVGKRHLKVIPQLQVNPDPILRHSTLVQVSKEENERRESDGHIKSGNLDLAKEILVEICRNGDEAIVRGYIEILGSGKPITEGAALEVHNAVMLCGFNDEGATKQAQAFSEALSYINI